MEQPFSRLGYIPSAQEIIDVAFGRASRRVVRVPKGPAEVRARAKERDRVRIAGRELVRKLEGIVRRFPDLNSIHPFYRELADVLVGVDELKRSLGALAKACRIIRRLRASYLARLARATSASEADRLRREAYGRMASVVKRVSKHLDFLREAAMKLAKLPSIDPGTPTIVVAGYANVGKSSFVKAVSSAKPEVASYPFTTRSIVVGHRDTPHGRVQVIDTPGLLDRPLSERNPIELQAILALKHLARVIVFLVDPTNHCGFPLDSQVRLLEEVRAMFPDIPLLVALNKADIATEEQIEKAVGLLGQEALVISALTGEGVEEAFGRALELAFGNN
ncbi:MAG TPA: NOG1 family protein [Candidatus Bathyarchaeota archaeon]|nr:NOG1 family protein [Candidatus Bathyarchaeota archaeon]